jgi:RNA polymerase sigma factor (sigma-70 family)
MRGEERIYSYDFLSDAEQPCLYEELQREVQKAVDALPDRCREVFRMSRFEGLKNREIAARLGISETAVEKHLARAVGWASICGEAVRSNFRWPCFRACWRITCKIG